MGSFWVEVGKGIGIGWREEREEVRELLEADEEEIRDGGREARYESRSISFWKWKSEMERSFWNESGSEG